MIRRAGPRERTGARGGSARLGEGAFFGWILAAVCAFPLGVGASEVEDPALPEVAIPLENLPERPRPLIEIGNGFLEPTKIGEGWTLPTGAVWQPAFLLWGTARTALQAETGAGLDQAQWANRLDLFGQLSLTPTERVVVGIEPFQGGGEFTGYRFGLEGAGSEFVSDFNFSPDTLFFEGDFGELFPRLDRNPAAPLDLGFMVGRVPVNFQDGFLIDDRMTAFGLVKNTVLARGTANLRLSFLGAWDGVHRGDNSSGRDTVLGGFFAEFDRAETSWAVDAVYVNGDAGADGVFAGISAIRRIKGRWNWSSRLLGSYTLNDASDPAVEDGLLGVLGISFSPRSTHHLLYLNAVASAGHYTAASRGADRGGPLGRVGILFEAPGLGSIGAPLPNDADQVFGGAVGAQLFFDQARTQLVLEAGGRGRFGSSRAGAVAGGFRFQQALGRRVILRFDGYGGYERDAGRAGAHGGFVGGRSEVVVKF